MGQLLRFCFKQLNEKFSQFKTIECPCCPYVFIKAVIWNLVAKGQNRFKSNSFVIDENSTRLLVHATKRQSFDECDELTVNVYQRWTYVKNGEHMLKVLKETVVLLLIFINN